MANAETGAWRTPGVSFLVAGVVMIGVSFVYHRVDQRFAAAPRPPAE
ncbi:MAG TPA: hypothetical protein VH165_01430 [Kofleriaceae bacterium]|jgi:hypothetical protein|nr:hypothetical protein [Kofleriaceae bacterium]